MHGEWLRHTERNLGPIGKDSRGYARADDAFAKHLAQHCRDCNTSNKVRCNLKQIVTPTIIWQGGCSIRCAKMARTLLCKVCMTNDQEKRNPPPIM
jgi:hypothetical protein